MVFPAPISDKLISRLQIFKFGAGGDGRNRTSMNGQRRLLSQLSYAPILYYKHHIPIKSSQLDFYQSISLKFSGGERTPSVASTKRVLLAYSGYTLTDNVPLPTPEIENGAS